MKTTKMLMQELKDYFRKQQDEDYMAFDDHPLSNVEDLMNPSRPAPWDHLTNEPGDEDIDIDIEDNSK